MAGYCYVFLGVVMTKPVEGRGMEENFNQGCLIMLSKRANQIDD